MLPFAIYIQRNNLHSKQITLRVNKRSSLKLCYQYFVNHCTCNNQRNCPCLLIYPTACGVTFSLLCSHYCAFALNLRSKQGNKLNRHGYIAESTSFCKRDTSVNNQGLSQKQESDALRATCVQILVDMKRHCMFIESVD